LRLKIDEREMRERKERRCFDVASATCNEKFRLSRG
jgi:hypothetical protein